jgi:hypothetical protein
VSFGAPGASKPQKNEDDYYSDSFEEVRDEVVEQNEPQSDNNDEE